MRTAEIRERTRTLIVDAAPKAGRFVGASATLVGDLGYDSLGLIELTSLLEAEFDLPPVPEEDALAVETVGDAEELVVRMLERAASGSRA